MNGLNIEIRKFLDNEDDAETINDVPWIMPSLSLRTQEWSKGASPHYCNQQKPEMGFEKVQICLFLTMA